MDQTDHARARLDVGDVLLDKLRIDGVLGRGGMGTVYRVTHLGTRHTRALKVMHPELQLHPEALTRFLREATVSSTLRGSNVVETIDCGRLPDGSHYVLMELLDGRSLADELDGGRRLPLARIARLLAQAADGLAVAHDAGIVHRDVKPDNLFVVDAGREHETLKILDFGIAHFQAEYSVSEAAALTGENVILGTPLYMAPEQISAPSKADGRADVYALGVVLYEALAGVRPYAATSFVELIAQILEGQVLSLRESAPGLPLRAYALVERAMERDREARPDARALAQELRALATQSVSIDALGTTHVSDARSVAETVSRAPLESRSETTRDGRITPWLIAGACTIAITGAALARWSSATENETPVATPAEPDASRSLDAGSDAAHEDAASGVGESERDAPPAGLLPVPPRGTRPHEGIDAERRRGVLLDPDEIYGAEP